jgi:hypothetical protein
VRKKNKKTQTRTAKVGFFLLAFVDKTEGGKVRPVKVLEKERLVVQCVYGEMISAVLFVFLFGSDQNRIGKKKMDGWM